MKIEYLADHLELLPEIAALTFAEWKDLCTSMGRDLGQVKEILAQRAVKDRIPLTLIVLENDQFVATGSIKLSEPDTKKDVSPWLDMMYIENSRRGCGIGRLLLEALEKKAWEMGAKALYLSTDEAEDFYAKNNWSVLEHQKAVDGKIVALMAKDLSRVHA